VKYQPSFIEITLIVPSEVLLPGGIVSKVHIRQSSPINLQETKEGLMIVMDKVVLSPAAFLPRPSFWNYSTNNGTPTKRLAHFYGATAINFNIFSGCQFYDVDKACKFCSVKPTQNLHHGVEIRKSPQDLADTCRLAVEHDNVEWFLATGGSYLDGDVEFDAHIEVLSAVREQLPWHGRLRGNLSLMPPKSLSRLDDLYNIGVDHPSFNLEVWPEDAFTRVCPGKSEYVGFKHILAAHDRIVRLYGSGHAWCNFVAGITPLKDLTEGFTYMAERGIVPGANIFHPDVGSPLGLALTSPDEDYIRRIYNHAAELYHFFGYKPFFDTAVLRNSLANEAYEGLL